MKKTAFCLSLCGALVISQVAFAGLGFLHDDSKDYLKSQQQQSLKLLPGMQQSRFHDYYHVPALSHPEVKPMAMLPPGSKAPAEQVSVTTKSIAKTVKKHLFKVTETKHGKPALMLRTDEQDAWQLVAKGVKKIGYRIATKDIKAKTIYILDSLSAKRITKRTPIYRLALQDVKNQETLLTVSDLKGKPLSNKISADVLVSVAKGILLPDQHQQKSVLTNVGNFFKSIF